MAGKDVAGMENEVRFMQAAVAEARLAAAAGEVPIGAVLVHQGEIIARGNNRTIRDCDPTAHAEMVVLRAAAQHFGNYRLAGSTIYVTLEPCLMCAGAMVQARIARVVFGADDPKGGAARTSFAVFGNANLNHEVEFTGGLLAEEAAGVLREFFAARR
jgi:tRNA(adenine34) deaminase